MKSKILMRIAECWLMAIFTLAIFPAQAHRASTVVASARQSYNLQLEWLTKTGDDKKASEVGFNDTNWSKVSLPNAFNEAQAFAVDIHKLSEGITWYRKHFKLPGDAKSVHAFLEFEGVRQAAEVWVNGQNVGLNENGVMAFGFDITKALKSGDNVIAVRVDNTWKYKERATDSGFQWSDMNFYANYGGINRPVSLHITGDVYQTLPLYSSLGTTGVYVWGEQYEIAARSATVHVESQIRNESNRDRKLQLQVVVRDLDGKAIAKFSSGEAVFKSGAVDTISAQQHLSDLNFWSWGYGYLYTVTTALVEDGKVIDAVDTRTGFRSTDFGGGTVKLNGRVLQMKGYAQRSTNEWPAVGVSVPTWLSDFSNNLMLEGNGNLVRWMHVTPSKQIVESCDRLGLIQAMPAGDSEGDPTGRRWDQRLEVMRDAIIYNRNNPSILFYESGNKGVREEHMVQMRAIRDQYDPHGGRASGSREMLDGKGGAEYGGEMLYINKSAKLPFWAMEYSRDEAARAFQDDFTPPFHKNAPAYNQNVESLAVENVRRWWDFYRYRPGTGDRVSAGGVNIGFTDSNSHFRGDNNYRRSGEVDPMRIAKDSLWVHKVMWDGWVNAEGYHSFIVGHWTYAPGTVKDVFVASNGDSVELFLNGKSLGKGERSDGFLFTFKSVKFEQGELKAIASYADGKTSTDTRRTAGPATALRLKSITGPRGFVADGIDVALVDVEVIDKEGNVVPTAFNPVSFKLDGAAVWKGGIAQKGETPGEKKASNNYVLETTLPVEVGVNRVMLRSTDKAGKVKLTATAEGLKSASLNWQTTAVQSKDGLSTVFPQDFQQVNLSRGSTPLTPSYTDVLRGVKVLSISAGSNQADAVKSRDDNETTAWNSDGQESTAWIEYELAPGSSVSQVSLKLTGWRNRSYPLRISVDNNVVFQGIAPKSLGYVDFAFAALQGSKLRIALTSKTEDRDGFGNLIEVTATANKEMQSTGADKVKAGNVLSVIEADISGPAQ